MRMSQMKIAFWLDASILAIGASPRMSPPKPTSYELPKETAAFGPGPNQDAALGNCTACHSADYIKTQPQGAAFKKDFWQAEVTKMIKVYGAPIDESDVGKIVDYLVATH